MRGVVQACLGFVCIRGAVLACVGECVHAWEHGIRRARMCGGMHACMHMLACVGMHGGSWCICGVVALCVNAWGRERGRIISSQPKAPGLRPIEKVGLAAEARP